MNNNIIKPIFIIAFLVSNLMVLHAKASLLTINDYMLDTETNIVTNGTMQWLQWDETKGQSIAQALLLNTGWRLASTSNMADLYNDFFITENWGIEENSATDSGIEDVANDEAYKSFVSLFGYTARSYDATSTTFLDHYFATSALFGSDADMDTYYQKATARDAYHYTHSGEEYAFGAYASLSADEYNKNYSNAYTGVALVRNFETTSVPEPSTFILFLLGIFYFLFMNNKHIKHV